MTPFPSDYNPTGTERGGKFSPADILFKYLAFLPLFLLCLALCIAGGLLYLRYTTPKYNSSVQMLVKSGETNPVYGKQGDIVERALYGPRDINMSNEIQKLRSIEVVRRAVAKHDLHIQYFNEGNIKTTNIFNKVPYIFEPVNIADSNRVYRVRFTSISPAGFTILDAEDRTRRLEWNQPFELNGGMFKLVEKQPGVMITTNTVNVCTWVNPVSRATELLNQIAIFVADPNTTILSFSLTNDNAEMGRFILNSLVSEYIIYSKETKNVAAEATISFINERLDSLAIELADLEAQLLVFRDQNDILPIEQQANIFSSRMLAKGDELDLLENELEMLGSLEAYIRSPRKKTELVPSAIGINDPELSGLIGGFNTMRLEREKEAKQQQPNSLPLKQIDEQLAELQRSMYERFTRYREVLNERKKTLTQARNQYFTYLARLPEKERQQLEIQRQKNVKEGLFMYLLQRKEEIAITTTSTDPGYAALNPAAGSDTPVEPDEGKVRLFSILLGFLLPIGIIYLRDLLNDKLMTRDDISKATSANIIGEIGHVDNNRSLVVADKSRSIVSEQFRIVRSNLAFLMNQRPFSTILITSTVSGEGKSFIAINMAAVLALSGKKVALLEFDLRRPRILQNLGLKKAATGISNVLLGLTDPQDVFTPLPGYPDLHVYPSGIVPPNPGELVLSEANKKLFDFLKANYDYVIIDSAPVGLVSDTFSLAPYVDTTIFIVRHRYTYKRQLSFVEEIYRSGKLPYLWLVVNDLKMGARFGYYGYGYGYGKGYGYGYGHYYGYGGGYFSKGADDYYDVHVPGWRRTVRKLGRSLRGKR